MKREKAFFSAGRPAGLDSRTTKVFIPPGATFQGKNGPSFSLSPCMKRNKSGWRMARDQPKNRQMELEASEKEMKEGIVGIAKKEDFCSCISVV